MVAIFEYIDRLFNIVRPRRLLYMAIDGVVSTEKIDLDSFIFAFVVFQCLQWKSAK